MDINREKKILMLLAVIFLIILFYRFLNPWEQARVEKLTYSGKKENSFSEKQGTEKKSGIPDELLTDFFPSPPDHSGKTLNDNFFKIIPGMEAKAEIPASTEAETVPEEPAPSETAEDEIYEDMDSFKVIGLYASGKDLAVFMQQGKQSLIIRKGDRVGGKYLVEQLTTDALTLKSVKNQKTIVIDLKQFLKPHEKELLKGK